MFNARSLKNKFSDLEALATSEEFHIITVSKSWINTEFTSVKDERVKILVNSCIRKMDRI